MPPPRVLQLYREMLAEHRAKLDRLINRRGSARIKRLYQTAEQELMAKLAARAGSGRQAFTAHVQRLMLIQLRQGQAMIAARMAGELGDLTREAQTESLHGLSRSITRLEHKFKGVTTVLPIDEAARFQGVIDKRKTSLLRQHVSSMNRYGARLVGKMEGSLSQALLQGETTHEAIGRIELAADAEWYQAERIVRTEVSWAYNASQADGIADISGSVGGMWMRWTEFVDDSSYKGRDDRVGEDSEAMHGQVAPPGGMFTQPPTTRDGKPVSKHLVGKKWSFPPNRPNDRSTLAPWRPEWGIPGWQWIGGRRVPVRKIPTPRGMEDAPFVEAEAARG